MKVRPTRRAFVATALAAVACPRATLFGPPVPSGPLTLGWRLVPGLEVTYRSVVARRVGEVVTRRAEEWSYVVSAVDEGGNATLEGGLTAFGAGIDVGDEPVPDAHLAGAWDDAHGPRRVTLRVALDGRLLSCSARDFAEALPHRAVALGLPSHAVVLHEEWPDAQLARAFAGLVPLDLDVAVDGRSRLLEVHSSGPRLLAAIETTGSVRATDGPRIVLTGRASFDLEAGRLARRTLEARFEPASRDSSLDPGVLSVDVFAV